METTFATSPKPTLSALMSTHHLTALAIAHASQVHVNIVLMALGKTCIHIRDAKAVLEGINQLAGTDYALIDLNPDCYYGGLIPGSMYEWKGEHA